MQKYFNRNDGGRYDFVFAGATFLAAGAAGKLAKSGFRCLVFDRLMMPGHEFSYSYRTPAEKVKADEALEPESAMLYRELESRGAVSGDGRYYLPALTPALSLIMSRDGIEYFPLTSAVGAGLSGGVWDMTLVSPGTMTHIEAEYIVDTTPEGDLAFLCGHSPDTKSRILSAIIAPPAGYTGPDRFISGPHEIFRTGFPDEYIARFRFAGDIFGARAALREYITSAPEALRGWQVISVADEFDITRHEKPGFIRRGFINAASTYYPDAVVAYDAGVKLAGTIAGENISGPEAGFNYSAPVIKETRDYDLIVAGLGTAGAVAAIAAARRGLKVLGIEQMNCMGGTGTAGGIPTQYLGFKGGLYEEIDREAELLRRCGFAGDKGAGCLTKALSLERAAVRAGVALRPGASVVGVIRDDNNANRILGVRWVDSAGIHEARAKYTLDATADAQVCIMVGCEMLSGRPIDGGFQLYSNVSRNYSRDSGMLYSTNQDDGAVCQYNPAELGRAVISSCISPLHLPSRFSFGRHRKLGPAPLLGIREGRRIAGESTVTLPDITDGRFCKDPLFFEYANLDNHGKDTAFEERSFRDWIEVCSLWDCRISIPVPAGALIPRGYSGLLAAGRCISVDHSVAFAVRMKDAMQKCGEAAGEMIALAKETGCDVREIPYSSLKDRLVAGGVIKTDDSPRAYYYNPQDGTYKRSLEELAENTDMLKSLISSGSGGAAIMAAARNIKKYADNLREWMRGEGEGEGEARLNCALALCLGGCVKDSDEAADVIIQAISDRSGRQSESSYTFNFPYAVSAMSVAGRAGLAGAVPALLEIILDPHYADRIPCRDNFTGKTKLVSDDDDIKFIYFTAALAALREICELRPEVRRGAAAALTGIYTDHGAGRITSVSMIGHNDGIRRDLSPLINEMLEQIKSY